MLGGIDTAVRLIADQFREYRGETKDELEKMWVAQRRLAHDHNSGRQTINTRMEMSDRRAGEIERRLGVLADSVAKVQTTVDDIAETRLKIKWIIGLAATLAAGISVAIAPFYHAIVELLVGRFLGTH